jgi:rubrerythrin
MVRKSRGGAPPRAKRLRSRISSQVPLVDEDPAIRCPWCRASWPAALWAPAPWVCPSCGQYYERPSAGPRPG